METHIDSSTPLNPAIQAWEVYLQDQDRSIYTVKSFVSDLQLFASRIAPDKAIGSISTNDINLFLRWLQHERGVPCSPKSLSRRITSIKSFFRWLHLKGRIKTNPAEKVIQKTVISPLPSILSKKEIELALEAAAFYRNASKPDARYYTLFKLLLDTGIKKGECVSLGLNHVNLDSPDGAFIFIRYNNPKLRNKERKLETSPEWCEAYQEYLLQYNPKSHIFPWTPRLLEYLLADISTKAGIDKQISFDMCRWTCAVRNWESGMEKDTIRQKMGISKVQWREVSRKLEKLSHKFNLD